MLVFLKNVPSVNESLLKFNHLHYMRFTFVTELFSSYGLLTKVSTSQNNQVTLEEHLTSLQTSYIWNIYKQLSSEMLEKAAELPYSELERNFKKHIMDPLADTILNKTVRF